MTGKQALALLLGLGGAALLLARHQPNPSTDQTRRSAHRRAQQRAPSLTERATPEGPEATAWWSDRLMVRLAAGADGLDLARDLGVVALRPPGPAGLMTLQVPEGLSPRAFAAQLAHDPRVLGAAPSGRLAGASDLGASSSLSALQWHLRSAGAPSTSADLSAITIAVLDTGLAAAYDDADCAATPSLAGLSVVAPWDFVNDDAAPCDDHQHGTHITSLIASDGAVLGLAPGVTVMPIKVLDADNSGDEQALIDGLRWAIDNGADVINLSLSFADGYVPSGDLLAALRAADDAGVVMVGAAGNLTGGAVTWPAASPLVISVGASALAGGDALEMASYSSAGPQLDLLAPGGSLDGDTDGDGHNDGVLAETIAPGDPSTAAYYYYQGSSQAAAQVSAAAAWLLAAGAAPEEVTVALQAAAEPLSDTPFLDGAGAGSLDLSAALELVRSGGTPASDPVHASVLPTLWRDAATRDIVPTARILVVDDEGDPVSGVAVLGRARRLDGAEESWTCPATVDGLCEVRLDSVDEDGGTLASAWRFTVDGVVLGGVMRSPTPMVYGSDGLELIAAALGDLDAPATALAFLWDEREVEGLGPLASGATLLDLAGDGARAPTALVLTRALVERMFEAHALSFDAHGSGLSSDALGVTAAGLSTDALGVFSGSGLSSDALGVVSLSGTSGSGLSSDALGASGDVIGVRGSGLASDALGLTALALTSPGYGEDLGLGLTDTMLLPGSAAASALEGTRTADTFDLSGSGAGTPAVLWVDEAISGEEVEAWPDEPTLPEAESVDPFEP